MIEFDLFAFTMLPFEQPRQRHALDDEQERVATRSDAVEPHFLDDAQNMVQCVMPVQVAKAPSMVATSCLTRCAVAPVPDEDPETSPTSAATEPSGAEDYDKPSRPQGSADRRHGSSGKKRSREPRARVGKSETSDHTSSRACGDDDSAKDTAEAALDALSANTRGPVLLLDGDRVRRRFGTWCQLLPRIQPNFAVAGSPDRALLQRVREDGGGFFCATAEEVRRALSFGAAPQQVVLTSPCAPRAHLRILKRWGVHHVCFDSEAQLHKIALEMPSARLLLSIAPGATAAVPGERRTLVPRFGARREEWGPLLSLAEELHLRVVGVSLQQPLRILAPPRVHTAAAPGGAASGAGGAAGTSGVEGFQNVVHLARAALDALAARGAVPEVVDLSAGLADVPPLDDRNDAAGGAAFAAFAACACEVLERTLPTAEFPRLRVVAEVGQALLGHGGASLLTRALVASDPSTGEEMHLEKKRAMAMRQLQEQLPGMLGSTLCSLVVEEPQVLRTAEKVSQDERLGLAANATTADGSSQVRDEWLLWRGLGPAACRLVTGGAASLGTCRVEVVHYSSDKSD